MPIPIRWLVNTKNVNNNSVGTGFGHSHRLCCSSFVSLNIEFINAVQAKIESIPSDQMDKKRSILTLQVRLVGRGCATLLIVTNNTRTIVVGVATRTISKYG
jgi:hypothetical protein